MKKLLFTMAAIASFAAMSAQAVTVTGIGNVTDDLTATHVVEVDLPAIAILDIHSADMGAGITTNVAELVDIVWSIDATAITEAGEFFDVTSFPNVNVSVNHTYVPAADGQVATMTVALSNLIPGFNVVATVGADIGSSVGDPGSPNTGTNILTVNPQIVRSGILASYTQQGSSQGTEIEYSLTENTDNASFGALFSGGTGDMQATLTYTLTGI